MTPQVILIQDKQPQIIPDVDTLIFTDEKSIGIDRVKTIKSFLQSQPLHQPQKTVIIYPAELLTLPAQNALLKILEEPPDFARIQLLTQNPSSLLPTILSRCDLVKNPISPGTIPPPHPSEIFLALSSQTSAIAAFKTIPAKLDRYALLSDLEATLQHYSKKLLKEPLQLTAAQAKLLIEAYRNLKQNGNISLTLTHLLLHWPFKD